MIVQLKVLSINEAYYPDVDEYRRYISIELGGREHQLEVTEEEMHVALVQMKRAEVREPEAGDVTAVAGPPLRPHDGYAEPTVAPQTFVASDADELVEALLGEADDLPATDGSFGEMEPAEPPPPRRDMTTGPAKIKTKHDTRKEAQKTPTQRKLEAMRKRARSMPANNGAGATAQGYPLGGVVQEGPAVVRAPKRPASAEMDEDGFAPA